MDLKALFIGGKRVKVPFGGTESPCSRLILA
jgi:hypothetical protein